MSHMELACRTHAHVLCHERRIHHQVHDEKKCCGSAPVGQRPFHSFPYRWCIYACQYVQLCTTGKQHDFSWPRIPSRYKVQKLPIVCHMSRRAKAVEPRRCWRLWFCLAIGGLPRRPCLVFCIPLCPKPVFYRFEQGGLAPTQIAKRADLLRFPQLPLFHIRNVSRPIFQPIENMGGVHNGRAPLHETHNE
jgi:hypothetical protein